MASAVIANGEPVTLQQIIDHELSAAVCHEHAWVGNPARLRPCVVAHLRNGLGSKDYYEEVGPDRYVWRHRN